MIGDWTFEDAIYLSYLRYHIRCYFEEHNMDMLDTTILQGEEYDGVFEVYSFEYSGKEYVVTSSVTGSYLIDKARYGKFFGFGKGLREVSMEKAMIICLAEPVLNPIWVYLGKGEIPSMTTLIGSTLIFLSAIIDIAFSVKKR